MKQNELEQALQADPELDAALAQMAEEVPPMPADFHDKWMDAVRADARDRHEEENGRRRAVSPARWTRILSAAAAFIFLIGGTVLYRNSKKSLDGTFRTGRKKAVLTAVEAPAAGDAAETEEDAAFTDGAAAGYAATSADTAVEEAAEDADYAVPPLFMNAAGDARAYEAAPEAASEDSALFAEEEAYEADYAVMEETEKAPLPTAMPTEPAAEEAEAEAEAPAETAEEPAAEGGLLQDAGAFFTDMGDFLLAALPYLAVLAVPAAAALVVRRRKKEKRGVR